MSRPRAVRPGTLLPMMANRRFIVAPPWVLQVIEKGGDPLGSPPSGLQVDQSDDASGGSMTESMTWMTPFEACTSAATTFAPAT